MRRVAFLLVAFAVGCSSTPDGGRPTNDRTGTANIGTPSVVPSRIELAQSLTEDRQTLTILCEGAEVLLTNGSLRGATPIHVRIPIEPTSPGRTRFIASFKGSFAVEHGSVAELWSMSPRPRRLASWSSGAAPFTFEEAFEVPVLADEIVRASHPVTRTIDIVLYLYASRPHANAPASITLDTIDVVAQK